jgi:3-methyladenine DNA glycosylase/8-oxoguanine DNA glycosylase
VLKFEQPLPESYRSEEVLGFYGRDVPGVSEQIFPGGLRKAMLIDGQPAEITIHFKNGSAACTVDSENAEVASHAVKRILGLTTDGAIFEEKFADDPLLGPTIRRQRGLRIPLTPEPWEALAWAIMGQQISVQMAVVLRRELIRTAGVPHQNGLIAHPSAATVAGLEIEVLRGIKFSRSKAEYLIAAARAVASGEVPLAEASASLLTGIRGIGPWTLQYLFLRGLGLADCLPAGDVGLARGLERLSGKRPSEREVKEMMARFAPFRSLATYHIWASLKDIVADAD